MFKELEIMKALRYLLITFAVMMISLQAVSVKAQDYAQPPRTEFQSTSSMVWSGSTLPQAAQSGAYTTYDGGTRANMPGIRRDGDPFGDETIGGTEKPLEPGTPIGDGVWALLALAAVYAVFRIRRKCV